MLKPQEWESVLDNIASGRTIICLGAELFARSDQDLEQQIGEALAGLDNVRLYADGLFHFKGAGDMTAFTKIKQFYNKSHPELDALLDQIAQLPVPLFICTSPDRQLERAFHRLELPYRYSLHHRKETAPALEPPTAEEPLIYNLLGDIEHRESMVLTHEDLFEFLESLMDGKKISRVLKERVQSAYNLIFLGLPFSKWYVKVLLHFLQKDLNKRALRYAANRASDTEIENFVLNEFGITCVPVRINEFVDDLCRRCAEAGLLRKTGPLSPAGFHEKWLRLVKNGELGDLLDEITQYFEAHPGPESDTATQVLLQLNARYSTLERAVAKGTVSAENAQLQRNQITDSLIQFIQDIVRPLAT
jgi:hypothetical protein